MHTPKKHLILDLTAFIRHDIHIQIKQNLYSPKYEVS